MWSFAPPEVKGEKGFIVQLLKFLAQFGGQLDSVLCLLYTLKNYWSKENVERNLFSSEKPDCPNMNSNYSFQHNKQGQVAQKELAWPTETPGLSPSASSVLGALP